ncbi:MAG TPA: glutathione S-transferase family protein [Candidatus Competibacter sp.]|nr:glutathione S-transferase family protein [Candidatus Competibacter sp.]
MRPMLVIGNKNYSSWSLRPWLAARHTGIEFDEIRIPLYTPDAAAQIQQYSPSGKVPVWREGEFAVWDSLAICEYLAERVPSLWPADLTARAVARSISAEMHSGFVALRTSMTMNARARGRRVAVTPEIAAEIDRIAAIWTDCRKRFGAGGPWLFGGFSIADAMFGPVVLRFVPYGVSRPGVVDDYVATWMADPHLQAWITAAEQESEVLEQFECGR